MLQSLNHLCGPSVVSLQFIHIPFTPGHSDLDPAFHVCLTSEEEKDHHPSLLTTLLLMQARILLAFFSARVHCWLIQLGAIQDPQMLLSKAVLQPQPIVVHGVILPHTQDFVFAFVEHHGAPDSLFLQAL